MLPPPSSPRDVGAGTSIRPMSWRDIADAARVVRMAFEAVSPPDRATLTPPGGEEKMLVDWLQRVPDGVFVARDGGQVLGSAVAYRWGAFGLLGPVSVHPSFWGRGIGSQLMDRCLRVFAQWGCTHVELYTYLHSPRHVAFFRKCGISPHSPHLLLSHEVAPSPPPPPRALLSPLLAGRRALVVAEIRDLTGQIFPGLSLDEEIQARRSPQSEVLILRQNGRLSAFALCDLREASDPSTSGTRTCHIKFAAALPSEESQDAFPEMLGLCRAFAASQGCARISTGLGAARRHAARLCRMEDWRVDAEVLGMTLHGREGISRESDLIFSDWG